ncbi:MAG: caspase family protein [Mucilaginibacter sp.]
MKTQLTFIILMAVKFAGAQTEQVVIPNGHASEVKRVIVDDQRKYFYAADKEKIVMWDIATGYQLYSFPVVDDINGIGVSHAGDKIVYLNGSKIYCYSTINGKKLWEKGFIDNATVMLMFTPDDKRIWVPTDKGIGWYNAADGDNDYVSGMVGIEQIVDLYSINNDKDVLLVNSEGWQIRNAEYGTQSAKFKFPPKTESEWYLPYSKLFVSAAELTAQSSTLTFQRMSDGVVVKKLITPTTFSHIFVLPSLTDSRVLISKKYFAGYTPLVKYELYNTDGFVLERTINLSKKQTSGEITNGFLFGDKMRGYFSTFRDIIGVDLQTGGPIKGFNNLIQDVSDHKYNSTTGRLDIMADEYQFRGFNLQTLRPEFYFPSHSHFINQWAISNDNKLYADFDYNKSEIKKSADNTIAFSTPTTRRISILDTHIFFDDDDKNLYYSVDPIRDPVRDNEDKALIRYNLATKVKQQLFKYTYQSEPTLTTDNKTVISVSKTGENGFIELRDLKTNTITTKIATGKSIAKYVYLSADGKKVAGYSEDDKLLTIYDVAGGTPASSVKEFVPDFGLGMGKTLFGMNNSLSLFFATSSTGDLVAFNSANGQQVYKIHAHNNSIIQLYFSPDDRLIYTLSEDNTIKLWWAATGKLLGTVFLFKNSNDYVFVDEFGRFDGTPNGIKQLYYLKNRVVIQLDLVYEKYFTPNMFQRMLNGEVFPPFPGGDLNPVPKVRISYAQVTRNLNVVDDKIATYNNTTGVAEITVNASAENDKVDEIRLFHNGKIVNLATRGLFVTDNATGTDTKKYTINLLPGINSIRAVALNSQRTESKADEISVTYQTGAAPANPPAPANPNNLDAVIANIDKNATLHLVVVGINQYKNPKMSLNYALADATAFKDEAEKDAKTMTPNVKTYFITDEKADKDGILQALKTVQQNAKPQDVLIFYYAGHGVISQKNKEFYLVPNDVTDLKNVDEALAEHGIPSKLLQQYAIDIAAQKQVFILDACQSAGAFATLLTNDANQQKSLAVVARSTGTHWIAASGSQQFANEFSQLGHGAFTYVLLKAMDGEAASNKMVTINGLKNYLQVQVPDLMKKYNGTPQYPASYGFGSDFPVEVMK